MKNGSTRGEKTDRLSNVRCPNTLILAFFRPRSYLWKCILGKQCPGLEVRRRSNGAIEGFVIRSVGVVSIVNFDDRGVGEDGIRHWAEER